MAKDIILCVDLDGTLIATDSIVETIILAIKKKPIILLLLPFWLLNGKTYFKNKISAYALPDVEFLPYNEEVIELIKYEKAKGRKIALVSASVQKIANAVANHLQLFDEVYGSSLDDNLKGEKKRDYLVAKYGEYRYDYIADSVSDIPVWLSANQAYIINPKYYIEKKLKKKINYIPISTSRKNRLSNIFKEIRVYQWLKNLLLFIPLLLAHKIDEPEKWLSLIIAFFSFCFTASFVYLLNDLLDLESDRHHPRKCKRPIASGNLSIGFAILSSPLFLCASFLLSLLFLPFYFTLVLFIYLVLTSLYSLVLKRIYLIDIILLSSLYTIRLIAGAYAVDVPISYWLLAFSMFIFYSIAIVKRYTELIVMLEENKTYIKGRGYSIADMSLLRNIGTTSGFVSVLVFILYVNSEEIRVLYKNPEFLWPVAICILIWISRIWFIAHRGLMHDDPVVFMSKDKISYFIALIILLLIIGASL